jgi:alkanesulfonate monooxygenase SsuD/methylene tetrahydromethanopterin reductase-like flavin-dependent oxidoreductase (luciferase family)
LATRAEKEGFDSMDYNKNSLAFKPTPYDYTPDGSLPSEYQNTLDPLDVLTYVAYITNKIALGMYIIDIFFYTPIMIYCLYFN